MTKARIMVVEDEVLVCKDIASRLRQMDYEVVATVGKGADAISSALECTPDLIMMDIHLRDDIDGIEAAETIHRRMDVPIIFCTAYSNDETLQRAKITAPYGYILKPFDNRELEINLEIALYKHRTERMLLETEGRLNTTISNVSEGVIGTDRAGRVAVMNPAAEMLTRTSSAEIRGISIRQLLELRDFDSRGHGIDLKSTVLREGRSLRDVRQHLISRDGSELPVEINAKPIPGDGRQEESIGMVVCLRDISQQLGYETQIRRNAFYDPLTSLPNRTLFLDRVGNAIYRSRQREEDRFAVLFLDLDQFRTVNEGLGHGAGDHLIIEVSRRISYVLDQADTLSRFGGDIFGVLLENHGTLQEVLATVERIKEQFSDSFEINNHIIDISCCIGIVISHEHYHTPEDMVRDADTAMHRAKAEGKGTHTVFNQDMYTRALRYIEWRDEMQRALEERKFRLHFQPIVSTDTGKVSSVEALVRWQSEKYGPVSPAEFIPVAEESGLILPLGRWIIESVCEHINLWKSRYGVELKVGVNLSAAQFNQSNLALEIRQILRTANVPPRMLGVEITESVAMRDIEFSIDSMSQLKELGISISIDDFGTGYSSLAYLKRFPISTLKIDRSFVTEITRDRNDQAIAASIIALAKALELDVLAEGVETSDQYEYLLGSGCDLIQGYYFSRALASEELIPFLQSKGFIDLPENVLPIDGNSPRQAG
ncbi:MAG: EAL domain-containing protein [Halieaceae bacterium]|nr:EAL domain-containing protein [Halieaceae bacterium]